MSAYRYRPVPLLPRDAGRGAVPLAGGPVFFERAEVLTRAGSEGQIAASEIPTAVADRLTAPRPSICGVTMDAPRIMAVVNVTPDSFSDGGRFLQADRAIAHGRQMVAEGADFLDIGGESTRPGAAEVPVPQEVARVVPVIEGLRGAGAPISIDTRKADVAKAAIAAGAALVNDVAAMTFDPRIGQEAAASAVPICLMHAQGDPETMQENPHYDNVLLDVFDFLEARVDAALALGIPRRSILIDPGIGFGKTLDHNLALLRGLSLFHGLGVPILLGVSRKRFIGTIGQEPQADRRAPGSIAVALDALRQGVQIVRVHDTLATRQAFRLWSALDFQ